MGPGRPSSYKPEYCQTLIEHMASGLSFESFAGKIGVDRDTLYEWTKVHPEFSDAKKKGTEACLFWWEQQGVFGLYSETTREGRSVTTRSMNAAVWIFNMKARFRGEWRDADKPDIIDQQAAQSKAAPQKVSFTDFCERAGYPRPYPKQCEMKDFGLSGEDPRLLLGSRGYGKTDYITVLGVAFEIYCDPTFTCLLVTKSKTRNTAMLGEVAKALEKNGVTLEKNNSECVRIAGLVGKDHSVSATTVKSVSLRGRHPKLVIMDDPVTPDDVSDATRRQVERTYNEICKLTQNVLVIGQPVHQYDLFEKLRPMIRKLEVPYGSIPELDPDLEAMKLAGVDEASISASYHLKVLNEGSTPFDKIRYLDRFPTGESAVAFIDPSHEGGDYTALSIIKAHMDGIAVVGFTWKRAWNHCLDEVASRIKQFRVQKIAFETNALGDQPILMLRQALPSIGVIGRRSNNNKHSRIMAAGAFAHLIHLSRESDRNYIDQVVKYEYKAKHDDAPDSLATGLEWIGLVRGKQ